MQYPKNLERLFCLLNKLPGVGRRTAQRYGFDLLLHWSEDERRALQHALESLSDISRCLVCGALQENRCLFCNNPARRQDLLCVVGSAREVFTIEQTGEFSGCYHVLDGLLSPLDGRSEESLGLEKLIARMNSSEVREIILALDSSLEGDATSLFLKDALARYSVNISRLAFGIPVGSTLEYVDGGTIARAFVSRHPA